MTSFSFHPVRISYENRNNIMNVKPSEELSTKLLKRINIENRINSLLSATFKNSSLFHHIQRAWIRRKKISCENYIQLQGQKISSARKQSSLCTKFTKFFYCQMHIKSPLKIFKWPRVKRRQYLLSSKLNCFHSSMREREKSTRI